MTHIDCSKGPRLRLNKGVLPKSNFTAITREQTNVVFCFVSVINVLKRSRPFFVLIRPFGFETNASFFGKIAKKHVFT
jgi:hypothetical protein